MNSYKCVSCDIELKSMSSYRYHCQSKRHLKKIDEIQEKQVGPIIVNPAIEIKCEGCNKSFYSIGNVNRHKKNCKESKIQTAIANNDGQSGNSGNITINIQQNIVNNIELSGEVFFYDFWEKAGIRPMGFEDLSGLDSQEIADKIHGFGLNCFVEFINQVYKNEVNHNIALFNKRDKLVKYIHKSGEIKIDSLSSVMSSVLMNLVDYLDSYLEREDIIIKPEFLSVIKKLKEIHMIEENPNLDRYNTHLYNRLLNITTSSLKKMKNYDSKIAAELRDSLRKLSLSNPRTDARTEGDILAV